MIGVLVIGDVINDVIVRPAGPTATDNDTTAAVTAAPGGSGANLAAWLAASGVPVRLAARVGAGDADRHRQLLAAAGVDARLAVDHEAPTGSIVVLVGGEGSRSMFTDRAANAHLTAGDLPLSLLDDIGHLHVSGYALLEPDSRAAVAALWKTAGESRLTRSVDVASAGFLGAAGGDFVGWSEGADVVFANLAEGRVVTGAGDHDGANEVVARLLQHYGVAVLKLGAEGALAATAQERAAGPPVEGELVDPTGAGDAFDAGFLAAWLERSELAAAAAAGARAAAVAVGVVGGRPPTPTQAPNPAGIPWEELRNAARQVAEHAFAPYSGLSVGAAGLADDGQMVSGCNVENASFGMTLCAECGLVSALRAAGGERLVAISVVAGDGQPLAPCGRCRQVLLDNGGPGLLIDRGAGAAPVTLDQLLPGAFDAEELFRRSPL
ncbi:MAG TPA: cytidine deaminase [Acidimicrobiales bacterium]|jgi:homotetrameric cytidine deaminase|nr:cytidine deaminase [Acidimicrobiales bacterium]